MQQGFPTIIIVGGDGEVLSHWLTLMGVSVKLENIGYYVKATYF